MDHHVGNESFYKFLESYDRYACKADQIANRSKQLAHGAFRVSSIILKHIFSGPELRI